MNANISRYDLLILDMVFPGENGREIAREYRSRNKEGMFVFCTGKLSPIPEDFRMEPYRYMRKEYPKRLRRDLLETVEEMYRRRIKSRLKVTEGKTTVLLQIEDILYLEIAKSGSYIYYFKKPDELCTIKVKKNRGNCIRVCLLMDLSLPITVIWLIAIICISGTTVNWNL